ncbi:hypothetical protein LSCM1_03091 [Leishmania martiniquensis]|uniref:Uncharacterized protein n=1 Tax=Leishmania martiniquensis TaxID=1580590 RepID=A0A836HAX0_9TRYP|nr:hypothetical protein LSCM1_03091 [Leishmania martiniquensis]
MAFFSTGDDLHIEDRVVPEYHKQADFAAFLVNEYFTKPSKHLVEARYDDTNGLLPLVLFDSLLPGGDIERTVGHICEETRLIDERHVQQRKPFHILEKPLLIPALLAALLHRILFEKAGVIISSTTFDLWASTALGFPARISRLWLDACSKVEEALGKSSVRQLLSKRSACDTGIHAIKMQADSKGVLLSVWCNVCSILCTSLAGHSLAIDTYQEHYDRAIECAVSFRQEIASKTSSDLHGTKAAGFNLHAAGEPELCSCLVFHSFFRQLETIFHDAVNSKVKMNESANVMCCAFLACLNAFTYYRYTASKAESIYKLLDTVAEVTDGRCLDYRFDLKGVEVPQLPRYVQRASVLSSDEIFNRISYRAQKERCPSLGCMLPPFFEMNYSAISMRDIFPFCSVASESPVKDKMGEWCAFTPPDLHLESEDDDSFVEMTTIFLDASGDEKCLPYILSAEEATVKREVQERLFGGKRRRCT